MRWPHARKALGLGFDHRLEIIPPQRALLLQIGADFRQVIFGNRLRESIAHKSEGHPRRWPKSLFHMVGGAGFEPATLAV